MPMAIPLLAAAGTAFAGMAAGGLIGGVMIAGAAMTAVGALTGNKNLMKWGGVLGLAGGVAGFATGAWSTAAEGLATQTASSGQGAQELFRTSKLGQSNALNSFGTDAISQANAAASSSVGMPGSAAQSVSPPATVNLVNGGGTTGTAGGVQGTMDWAKQGVRDYMTPGGAPQPTGIAPDTSGGGQGGILQSLKSGGAWLQANPRLAQAGSGILSAGLGAIGQQEAIRTQIQLQEDAQGRARQRLNDSVKGLNVPVYVPRGG